MNREIKFRVWDKIVGEMCEVEIDDDVGYY